jgi:hypothetical protein
VSAWTSVECTLKHNDVGSGQFVAPNSVNLYNAVSTPNNRVSVIRDGSIFMSGPIEHPGDYRWSADSATDAGPGVLTVNFASNELYLAERLTYPNPSQAATAQTVDYFVDNGRAAELVMRSLFDRNIGGNALVARKTTVPMGLGALAGVGAVVNLSTRFEVLTDVFRKLCTAGGGLGFRMRDTGTGVVFEVFAPRDRTKIVQFSRGRNNLRSLSTAPEAPTGTVALVGGANSGAARIMVERASATPWRRMEHFVNESGLSDTTGLQQSGDHANTDKAERVGLTATAVDSPGCRFGVDYLLGDRVAVELATGVLVTDVVRAVKLTATPEAGEVVSPAVGLSDPHTDTPTVRAVRDLYRRLGRLERT